MKKFMKQGPQVVVMGTGSYFGGKPVMRNMVEAELLRTGIGALADPDPAVNITISRSRLE